LSWNNETEAKRRAAALLKEHGHRCSERCRDWEPLPN
jgi:hypothetical protein